MHEDQARWDEVEAQWLRKYGHSKPMRQHVEDLRALRASASLDALKICRVWHGRDFGYPGSGDDEAFVARELKKATAAVEVCGAGVAAALPAQAEMIAHLRLRVAELEAVIRQHRDFPR